jgi:hypothetical protein
VVNGDPVPSTVPVVDESANQASVVPVGAVALSVTEEVPQAAPATDVVTADGSALMVAVTAVLVADTQPAVMFLAAAYSVFTPVVVYEESYVNDPLLSNTPAVAAVYQSMVSPVPGVAVKVTRPVPHLLVLTAAGALAPESICASTAVPADKQPPLEALEAT